MDSRRKLRILTDAARFDACGSRRTAEVVTGGPLEVAAVHGICQSVAGDRRSVRLLRLLFTNA